jgi:hypothetical protein
VAFNWPERRVIYQAVEALESQAGYRVDIVYDLDMHDIGRLAALRNSPRMARVDSSLQIVKDVDVNVRGVTFGWMGIQRDVYIVRDRIWTDRMLLHVVMHELLHIAGADHVSDETAVLHWQTDFTHVATVITEADREALRAGSAKRPGLADSR